MILFSGIVAVLFLLGLGTSSAGLFGKDIVIVLKPFLAFGIMFHHLFRESVFLSQFERWGPLIVGIFFFISGYGLMYSLKKRPAYLRNFFQDKILLKLIVPCMSVWLFDLIINRKWQDYSFLSHVTNPGGPFFFSNDWFIYVLVLCYFAFMLAGRLKPDNARLAVLVAVPLLIVLVSSRMGFDRNWWATPLAFSVGAAYCAYEPVIRNLVSCKRSFIVSTAMYVCLFGILMICSAVFKSNISTVLAYSLLPLLVVNLFIRIDLSRLSKNRIIIFLSGISFEIYLLHGILIDFFRGTFYLSGIPLIAVVIAVTLISAVLFRLLSVLCRKGLAALCSSTVVA